MACGQSIAAAQYLPDAAAAEEGTLVEGVSAGFRSVRQ